ncbi:vacuolar ATPase assembly integral membrane protein VMA21-like [Ruditapes philippinarum]|uniref:vacuolar ATPase assembly integral membrane protein VMA21-like n=1 Tax=Ruditapes philippinarum TaxID=129788 RepID=UPI00295B3CE1|nr:vacuolar ATPase assembly integral membrane protein VMA21-like [Ruditapes philippinarum]
MADDLRTRMTGGRERDAGVMKTMIIFSLSMLFFPVFLYFFSKRMLFELFFGMTSQDSYFYAAFVAIGTVHLILGMFVYKAFTEETSDAAKLD